MRALVLGVVGAVLAIGGSEAKSCRLDGAELVAKPRQDIGSGENAPAQFLGAKFRVVKQASRFVTIPDRVGNLGKVTGGSIAVEVVGKKGRFFIEQGYIPHSSPWIIGTSWAAGQKGVEVNWSKRNKKGEATYFKPPTAGFFVYDGPLSGLFLEPTRCH